MRLFSYKVDEGGCLIKAAELFSANGRRAESHTTSALSWLRSTSDRDTSQQNAMLGLQARQWSKARSETKKTRRLDVSCVARPDRK